MMLLEQFLVIVLCLLMDLEVLVMLEVENVI